MAVDFITWKDFYSVHCPELDGQHTYVLRIINDLYSALGSGREREAIKGMLDRLVRYTKDHFQREEELMKECGYPKLDEHKALHDRMTQKTIHLRNSFATVTGQNLLRFLKEWWINHICQADKQYSPYMEAVPSG